MIENILKFLAIPLLIVVDIMAGIAIADMIYDYLNQKKYTTALITIIVITLLHWPFAIYIAIYVGYKKTRQNKSKKQEEIYTHKPAEGSTADYERWKAEQIKNQEP